MFWLITFWCTGFWSRLWDFYHVRILWLTNFGFEMLLQQNVIWYYYIYFVRKYCSKIEVVILFTILLPEKWCSILHLYVRLNYANHKYKYVILRLKSKRSVAAGIAVAGGGQLNVDSVKDWEWFTLSRGRHRGTILMSWQWAVTG